MNKALAGCFIMGLGLCNLYLMWTRALGAEVRSWWWFVGCGIASMCLNTITTHWMKSDAR